MGKKGGGGGDSSSAALDQADNKHEQKLQAVLFGDSFTDSFRPITLAKDVPKVLCPLNNVTLLDYSMEFLAGAGVEEIFVICVHGASQVEDYVRQSKWSSYLDIHCIRDATCMTPGDALRELDKRSLVRSNPFVLMNGDVVTNVNLIPILENHKRRYKADSSNIMTMLFQQVGNYEHHLMMQEQQEAGGIFGTTNDNHDHNSNKPNKRPSPPSAIKSMLASPKDDLVVGWNPNPLFDDYRMVLYDNKALTHKVTLPCEFFTTVNSSVEIHKNLIPVGLDICSPEVLSRFSDEFDYQELYEQFVHESVLEEEEGLQSKIYAHVLDGSRGLGGEEYGARAKDFRSYHTISRDVMTRWCYPPVGLDNLPSGYETHYRYGASRHYVYREMLGGSSTSSSSSYYDSNGACAGGIMTPKQQQQHSACVVGRSTKIASNVILGSSANVGEHCLLKGAVIGHHVTIGNNVKVVDSHIWNGVTLEDNVIIFGSIIAQDCIIKKGAIIAQGCVLGRGVVIGTNVKVPPFTLLTACSKEDEADRDDAFDDDDLFSSSGSSSGSSSSSSEEEDSNEEGDDTFDTSAAGGGSLKQLNCNDAMKESIRDSNFVSDAKVVGKDGYGRVYTPRKPDDDSDSDSDDEDDEDELSETEELKRELKSYKVQSIGYDPIDLYKRRRDAQYKAEMEAKLFGGGGGDGDNEQDNFSDEEHEWLVEGGGAEVGEDETNVNVTDEFGGDVLGATTRRGTTPMTVASSVAGGGSNADVSFDGFASTTSLGGAGGGNDGSLHSSSHYFSTLDDDMGDDMMVKWGQQKGVDVVEEMKSMCMDHDKNNSVDNLAIELNSFKFSQNASFSDCSIAVMLAMLERMVMDLLAGSSSSEADNHNISAGKMALALQSELDHWKPLLDKFHQSTTEEMAILKAVENVALNGGGASNGGNNADASATLSSILREEPGFRFVLQTLEDKDIVKDTTILKWANERRQDVQQFLPEDSPIRQLFMQKATQDYLQWLEEEDEEDSSDDSGTGSDDDDDDVSD